MWRFACCCCYFQKAARFLLGENASCHLVCLTALQSAHRWTVEKRNTERVKNKSNSLSGRKGFFHNNAGNGKKLQAKQNRFGFQIFFEATKKLVSFQKTKLVNEHYKTLFFNRKVRRCGKDRLNT